MPSKQTSQPPPPPPKDTPTPSTPFLHEINPIYLQPWHTIPPPALRAECRTRGLRTDGMALDLISRLLASDKDAYKLANPLLSPAHSAAQQEHAFQVYEALLAHQFKVMDSLARERERGLEGVVRERGQGQEKKEKQRLQTRAPLTVDSLAGERERAFEGWVRGQGQEKQMQRLQTRVPQVMESLAEENCCSDCGSNSGYETAAEHLSPLEILLREPGPLNIEIKHAQIARRMNVGAKVVTVRGKEFHDERNANVIATVIDEYDDRGEKVCLISSSVS